MRCALCVVGCGFTLWVMRCIARLRIRNAVHLNVSPRFFLSTVYLLSPPVNPRLRLPCCLSPSHFVESVVEVIVCVGVLVVSGTYQTAASLALYLIAPIATILVRFLFAKGRCSRGMVSVDLTISKDRMTMFTDGVMAIAGTIIILDVEAPKGAMRMKVRIENKN